MKSETRAASSKRKDKVRLARELDTPALLVDLDVLDANIATIAGACARHGVQWRPHIKGQKVPELVRREIKAGAIGITCAKLGEAEVMANAGFDDILIANQIVSGAKIARLIALARRMRVIVSVDNADNVAALGAAASARKAKLPVVIEVDIGMKRAGVLPGAPALALAKRIAATRGVVFEGLMAWEAHAVRIADPAEKKRTIEEAVGQLVATAEMIRAAGLPVKIVSCGGTGTFPLTLAVPGVTEIQAGGGVLSDVCYRKHFHIDLPYALTLLATVTSRPNPRRIVCDAGKKSMGGEMALPEPIGVPGVASVRLSAEHTTIELERDDGAIKVGDTIAFVVGYGDTTVHLHEELYAVRQGKVEAIWRIAARGKTR